MQHTTHLARQALTQLHHAQYGEAKAIFWAGSVSAGTFTDRSDLDLVVIVAHTPSSYREAFAYQGWKIDAFIRDMSTLRRTFTHASTTSETSHTCFLGMR
jgi:hypothetical protein